ncbi:MAG: multiheme c-type cytochrome [Myxococcota bacterium]
MHWRGWNWLLGWVALGGLGLSMPANSASRLRAGTAGRSPAMPGPAHGRRDPSRMQMQSQCVECHPMQAQQWVESGHAKAFTAPTVQRAFEQEPRAFCRGCHAPEADPRRTTPAEAAAVGVACVSCHVVDGEILAGTEPSSDAPASPHAVRRDPAFTTARACARCHEFGFTDVHARRRPELMQSTVSEHRRSPYADVSCAQCHMPRVDGHRDHSFTASRDPELLRRAVRVEAQRPSACTLELSLTPVGVGHAFPTGDLMRRIEVRATTSDQTWSSTRYLARHWGGARPLGTLVRVMVADDRVGPGPEPRIVRFELPANRCDEPVKWSARYQRVQEIPGENEAAAVVVGEITLAAGTLARLPKVIR